VVLQARRQRDRGDDQCARSARNRQLTLRNLLGEREQVIRAGVDEHVERMRESGSGPTQAVGDAADQADVGVSRDNDNAAVARDVFALRHIEAARMRIAEGTAGLCLDCEAAIPFERLRVQSTAARCVSCQEVCERTHRLRPEQQM
jgi:RNA polymerase-binding transcription factor DksA